MRYLFLFLSLCLLLPEGRKLAAQNRHDSLRRVVTQRSWNIAAPRMSDDGKWLTVRKVYEQNHDTMLIISRHTLEEPIEYGVKTGNIVFVDNNHLLIHDSHTTEWLSLQERESLYFEGVKRVQVLQHTKQFLLHYNSKENNRLELRDGNRGNLLNSIDYVKNFYMAEEDGTIYVVSEEKERSSEVVEIRGTTKRNIYNTSGRIDYLEVDPEGEGIMIYEQRSEANSQNIFYLDLNTRISYYLNELLPVTVQNGFSEVIRAGNAYFLTLSVKTEPPNDTIVDIWYGNDNQLEEKFYPPFRTSNYVWEPRNHFIQQIGNDHLTRNININNERYFLSFDPYLLQDYSRGQPLLQMQIHDRVTDRYEIMDTIAPVIYLSGNGEYAISPKNQAWNLYHVPSGRKKVIHSVKDSDTPWLKSEESGTPWFTDDGTAILFEGDGALWKYDLKTGTLDEIAIFKGCQTHIVNGKRKGISIPHINIGMREVDLSAPLVIRLNDPKENITSYVLWHNGDTSTIIAPTTTHIQSLNYNSAYTRFSYIEEDYNMPPRLVYKEIGKTQRIVYEGNKEDKAISSLRQEIISYTNQDGVPLKGILYYPLDYTPSGKYPMVVRIYERQRQLANRYPYPSYYDSRGFNIRLLLENGYFVYLPDILIQGKEGSGMDALDCVNNALDALAGNSLIDKDKIGLMGHSFGGYEVNFIATHSDRFAAYVSGAGHSDIVWAYHAFNYNFLFPDHVRIIANIYKMRIPFTHDKALYIKNNPLYRTENVNAPVLLWTGTEDQNVTADHSMAFYNALRRNQKSVIALFYKREGHALQNKEAQFDLTSRVLDWFDYFLKDKNGIEWIAPE